MAETITTDYLVIGAGGMGMAFVDTLLSDTKATVTIVDRYHRPGGHWTKAYPFVRLHQPSAFYGVNSKSLGQGFIDQVGYNKGLYELATCDEILSYYDQLMNQRFLPSGRVQYFPNCTYTSDGQFSSTISGRAYEVTDVRCRIVNATYMRVNVPSMRPPSYQVASNVPFVTPNGLANIAQAYANYVVVGAGKTGIDSCVWLLSRGLSPDKITWIMPRDSWMFDRSGYQPGPEWAEKRHSTLPAQFQAIMAATSIDDLFHRLEEANQLCRITDEVWPKMFRCATISNNELDQLQRIKNIIRMGRVASIGKEEVRFESGGTYCPEPNSLFVDCTADGLEKCAPLPVFNGKHITLQAVRFCQQVFSAAFIGHVEAAYDDDATKNELCRPIPHPNQGFEWLLIMLLNHENTLRWLSQPKTAEWLSQSRLDWFGTLMPPMPQDEKERQQAMNTMATEVQEVCNKLRSLLGQLPPQEAEIVANQGL